MSKILALFITVLGLAAGSTFAAGESTKDGLDSKLQAARERLEQAAHEVAELSAEIGRPVMDRLMMMGEGPRRAIIGVQLDPASGQNGAKVKDVSPGGPAAAAGIRAADVIVMVDGKDVKGKDSTREVSRLMRRVDPDSKVNVRVLRDGKARDFVVVTRPPPGFFDADAPPPPPGFPGAPFDFDAETPMAFTRQFRGEFADMELASLTPELGRYFGTEEGVLVVRKPADDNALKLEDGDVILSIDGRKPTSGSHATRILRSYQPGEKITLRVMRQKKAQDLNVILPERERPRVKTFRTGGEPS